MGVIIIKKFQTFVHNNTCRFNRVTGTATQGITGKQVPHFIIYAIAELSASFMKKTQTKSEW